MLSLIRRQIPLSRLFLSTVNKVPLKTAQLHTSCSLWRQLVQFKLSDIGEGIREVTIKEWFVQPGDKVAQFDSICEVQSDKAAVTITSRYDGVIKRLYYEVDDVGHVGEPLVDIELDDDSVTSDSEDTEFADRGDESGIGHSAAGAGRSAAAGADRGRALATPAVRRMAAEHGLNVSDVQGSGKHGRVLKEDVLAHVSKPAAQPTSQQPIQQQVAAGAGAATAAAGGSASWNSIQQQQQQQQQQLAHQTAAASRSDSRISIKGVQKAMFDAMTQSARIPHFAYSDEIDMTQMMQVRQKLRDYAQAQVGGAPLSLLPFLLKAMSLALLDYPSLNAHLLESELAVLHKAEHNICIAVDSPAGLLVPCVRNVEQQSVLQLSQSVHELVEAGRANKLTPHQLSSGTITMSNIGSIGGSYMKPVIMAPQVCIGAVGRVRKLPRFGPDGQIAPADIMQVSWSADHRIVDGATVARFSNRWKQLLESPEHFMLMLR